MTISSRTPEGTPNQCPLCLAFICIEPSDPPGDAPCPNCGHLVWFISSKLEIPAESITRATLIGDELGADSLDLVQLVMEFEAQFSISIPEGELEGLKTVGDIIDLINQYRRDEGTG